MTMINFLVIISLFLWNISPVSAAESPLYSTVSQIFRYNTESISNFIDQINHSGSRNNQSGLITDPSGIEEINRIIAQNKSFLDQLGNKPVYKMIGLGSETPSLSEKIEQTKAAAATIYSGVQILRSRTQLLTQKWSSLTEDETKAELTTLSSIFTQDSKSKNTSLIALCTWLKTAWDNPVLVNLLDETSATQSQIENLLNDTVASGKISNPAVLNQLLLHLDKLDSLVGNSLAGAQDPNLYGIIKKNSDLLTQLDKLSAKGMSLLSEIKDDPTKDQTNTIEDLKKTVLGINLLPNASVFFSAQANSFTTTNQILDLLAIIDTNKLYLSSQVGQPVSHLWLENGSIFFRIVSSNPSRTQIQKVPVKFLLPPEINSEQILNHDPTLAITTEPIEKALMVSGEVLLGPLETRTLSVEVEDIWNIYPDEVEGLRAEVKLLADSLKNSPEFPQVLGMEKEINILLSQDQIKQQKVVTPTAKITTFREIALNLNSIEGKINSFKTTLSNSKIGPSTPIQGSLIFLVFTIVFLVIFFNALKSEPGGKKINLAAYQETPETKPRNRTVLKRNRVVSTLMITLVFGGLGAIGTSLAIKNNTTPTAQNLSPTQVLGTTTENLPTKFPYQANLKFPTIGNIPIRSAPTTDSPQIGSLKEPLTVSVFKRVGRWVQITGEASDGQSSGWWINERYLEAI